jgi:hypothetical protein
MFFRRASLVCSSELLGEHSLCGKPADHFSFFKSKTPDTRYPLRCLIIQSTIRDESANLPSLIKDSELKPKYVRYQT